MYKNYKGCEKLYLIKVLSLNLLLVLVFNLTMPMRQAPLKFTVQVPVKPYVKKFIESNYGSPVSFASHQEENYFFLQLLKQPCIRRDVQTNDLLNPYTEILEIFISEDDFYRYGWELTKTNILIFGKFFEHRAKFFMRNIVGIYYGLGLPIYKSIKKFQTTFEFDEDAWKYDSIKKDFYRHGNTRNIDFDNEIFHKIENIILDNLYDAGTISHHLKKQHERDFKTVG